MYKLFLCSVLLFLVQCSHEVLSPVALFTIRDSVEVLSLERQKQRIKYAEMLQPEVNSDSLVMAANIEHCPEMYIRYVNDFIRIMNHYLNEQPLRSRYMMLGLFQANSVRMRVLMSFVKLRKGKLVMTLSEEDAKKLGINDEYRKIMDLLVRCPMLPESFDEQDIDTSIFCDFRYLNDELSPVFKELKHAFDELNKSYSK